jgi:predicted nucleic acid-binding protein
MSNHSLQRVGILVDTSAIYAMIDLDQIGHQAASDVSLRLSKARWPFYTTNFVIAETHALLLTKLNRVVAARFLDDIETNGTTIERITPEDEQRARAIIRQYTDKDFSLTDATSFAVMERLGISHAFTLDRHFAQFGWAVLPETRA